MTAKQRDVARKNIKKPGRQRHYAGVVEEEVEAAFPLARELAYRGEVGEVEPGHMDLCPRRPVADPSGGLLASGGVAHGHRDLRAVVRKVIRA